MKREPKPFVVEVKRGKRRPSFGSEVESRFVQSNEASRRAELALFSPAPVEAAKSAHQGSEITGRILPSLIQVAPSPESVAEDVQPKRRGRKPGSKNKPKVSIGGELPILAARAAASRTDGAPPTTPNGVPALRASEPASASAPVEASTTVARVRLRERSAILARYVFESEPVPGERWKRPSRRKAVRTTRHGISA